MIVREIPLSQIQVSNRSREEFGDIEELASQIQTAGGLINPVLVEWVGIKNEEGRNAEDIYRLVAGERRFRAYQELGWPTIHCHIKQDLSDLEYRYLELSENLQRKQFEWWEEVVAVRDMHKILTEMSGTVTSAPKSKGRRRWGYRETAEKIGKALGSISNDILLADALDQFPALKKARTKLGAQQILERLKEEILAAEIAKRLKAAGVAEKILQELARRSAEENSEEDEKRVEFEEGETDFSIDQIFNMVLIDGKIFNINSPQPHTYISNVNCMDALACMHDRSVDLILTDPPYGLNIDAVGPKGTKFAYEDTLEYLEYIIPPFLRELYRVCKLDAIMLFFCSRELEEILRREIGKINDQLDDLEDLPLQFEIRPRNLIWVKPRGGYTDVRFKLTSSYESILLCSRGKKRITRPHSDIFSYKRTYRSVHAGEKPIVLLRELVDLFTFPGEVVLDPMVGVMNTVIACIPMNRIVVGFEKAEATFGLGVEKIQKAVKKMEEGEDEEGEEESVDEERAEKENGQGQEAGEET